MSDQLVSEVQSRVQRSIETYERELAGVRTGRAAPSLIENLPVSAYDSTMMLQELASITAPDATMLVVQPWDGSVADAIANALRSSDLNLNPVVEGTTIRVPIPPLTTERRQELVKTVGKKAEETRVAIRNIRHDAFSELKKNKDNNEISEDEHAGLEKRIQAVVDQANKQVESIAKQKEEELLTM